MAQIESVADLLKKHAKTRGHQIAFFTATGETVTYNDLEKRTRQIALNLLNAGISRECRVVIVLGSSIEAIEGIFAITRAAAVGVLLDARSSQVELTRAFESSRHAKGVFTSQYAFMWTAVNSLQLATSLNLTAADKIFWPLPLFHAFGHLLCVIGTLSVGASAHLVGEQPLLNSLLQSKESTIIGGAPVIFQEITKSADRQALAQIRPRACIAGGAATPTGLSSEVQSLFGVPLSFQYGSTECGLIATDIGIHGGMYLGASCGSPPQGVDVQIRTLGPNGQLLAEAADGDEGEICVRSASFMLGYNDDSLSPSTIEDGWYRTGDLGRQEGIPGTGQRILTVTGG
ncbi:polyketide synthase type 1 [Penicillium malachiteum]|uniref:polyketide synthase type 1 n=1 Tax=Penicillium malachiteum TaxID=1324776 RepID=UPI002547526F|nr:polyketide synthase type 1 [Penicillium malachiteum]KAJ5720999.1 polyketide synthase type 1 [Penicillium malachiteum]